MRGVVLHPTSVRQRLALRTRARRIAFGGLGFWSESFATHQPVLVAAAEVCEGPILECGSGDWSTPLLHRIARRRGLELLTVDDHREWLGRQARLARPWHELRHVEDWDEAIERLAERRWGLVFIDQHPWTARAATAARLRDQADLVVMHDCDYFPRAGLLGRMIEDVAGEGRPGRRDWSEVFTSAREFFPLEPWPFPPTGPPTLLASNTRSVDDIDVDYEARLPFAIRVARRVPQRSPSPR